MVELFAKLALVDELGERDVGRAVDEGEGDAGCSGRLRKTDWHISSL